MLVVMQQELCPVNPIQINFPTSNKQNCRNEIYTHHIDKDGLQ